MNTQKPDLEKFLNYINRNCERFFTFLNGLSENVRFELFDALLRSFNPNAAAAGIEDLLELDHTTVSKMVLKSDVREAFLAAVSGSKFLTGIMKRHPEQCRTLFLDSEFTKRKTRKDKEQELRRITNPCLNIQDFDREIRFYKEHDYLRIGTRDLAGIADVAEVMHELSDLAAAMIQISIEFHFDRLAGKYGRPCPPDEGFGLCALAMGKLSGRELNFSSDVDLIFLRRPEEGLTSGPEKIPVVRFYESVVQSATKSLSQVTGDGFVFRIDLRLRPEGEKGELVPSLMNALDYYLGWGRTWERAVLMKSTEIAGDLSLGREFLQELEPFIFRKHLDFSTLEEMRAMKSKIQIQLKRKPGINIKLGQGGIREIEFFVQALQLINAGRTPRVRSTSTMEALSLLREAGLLDKQTTDNLRRAYVFFRKTEHRIQINHQLQTHELPRSREDQEDLAHKMGFANLQDFMAQLDSHRRIVEDLFSGMFYQSDDDAPKGVSIQASKIIDAIHDEDACKMLLREAGFPDVNTSYNVLKDLLVPDDKKIAMEKGVHLLEKAMPFFLEEILNLPEPGPALIALDSYIDSLYAHSTYFSTLLENPPTLKFIIKILGESRFFTDLLIRHPQSIDSLIAKGAEAFPKSRDSLSANLTERLTYSDGLEEQLDVLRRFKNEEMLLIGVHHLAGEIESTTARKLITDLAEACLEGAVDIAAAEMAKKFGMIDSHENPPLVILGMGKLGGREMTYLSDLDVIFIYDSTVETIGKLTAHEWFSRFAGRIISVLNIPTSEGTAWAIDTRLRPSGNKGPLVSSIKSFQDYHSRSAQLWEKQALTRARPVSGPMTTCTVISEAIRNSILNLEFSEASLAEIAKLRSRMEAEIAQENRDYVDLKTGKGGLVDIEFCVQALILKHAKAHPEVLVQNTLEALRMLNDQNLLDQDHYDVLSAGYLFLINLEDKLRLMENRSIDRIPLHGDKLRGLAGRLGYLEESEFTRDYRRITESIRRVYNFIFYPSDNLNYSNEGDSALN